MSCRAPKNHPLSVSVRMGVEELIYTDHFREIQRCFLGSGWPPTSIWWSILCGGIETNGWDHGYDFPVWILSTNSMWTRCYVGIGGFRSWGWDANLMPCFCSFPVLFLWDISILTGGLFELWWLMSMVISAENSLGLEPLLLGSPQVPSPSASAT